MKLINITFLFYCIFLFAGFQLKAQKHQTISELAKDTTPIEDLDYELDKAEFLNYYGIDDTARLLIDLFFTKRTNSVVNVCAPSGCVAIALIADELVGFGFFDLFEFGGLQGIALPVLAGAIVVIFGIRGVVQRLTYTREALLYLLVERERGTPLPENIVQKLRGVTFWPR